MGGNWLAESVRWYTLLALAGWGLAPYSRWLLGGLSSRGAAVARPLALLLLIWPTWYLSGISPVPFTTAGLWLTLLLLSVAGWWLAWRRGWLTRDWLTALIIVELLTAVAFFAYAGLRGFTPEIVWTEKPMDVAFLSSTARTQEIPPADPWFAGEPINYYYLGYLVHGTIIRMTGVPTWTGYNLALATTAALALVAAGGAGFDIVRRFASLRQAASAAVVSALLVVLAGNIRAPLEVLDNGRSAIDQGWWGSIGWSSSRVVVDTGSSQAETINEFPWFSLLLGDLHPHLTALPFTLLAISVALSMLWARDESASTWERYARLVVCGGLVGALYPLNSLDLPTYFVVVSGAMLLRAGLNRKTAGDIAIMAMAAIALWLPFDARFVPFTGTGESRLPGFMSDLPVVPRLFTAIGWHSGERTSAGEFLTVFGLFWAVSVAYLVWRSVERRGIGRVRVRFPDELVAAAIVGIVAAVAFEAPVLVLAGGPLAVSLWLITGEDREEGGRDLVLPGLLAAAFGLVLLTEFFFVQDAFSGRYNTLFKVYYQVWTLLGVAAGVAVVRLWSLALRRPALLGVMTVASVACLFAASAYPVVATIQWTRVHGDRDWKGLDGAAFLEYHSRDDLAAIRWLSEHAEQDDVIVEAPGCSYQINGGMPTGRMAALTGVPNIIGWDFHEVQWRGGQPELSAEIGPRAADVATIYAELPDELLDRYGVTLLLVGSFERIGAGSACDKAGPYPSVLSPDFPGAGWQEIFASGDARIYRRITAGDQGEAA